MCSNKQKISIVRGTSNTFTVSVTDENGDVYTLAEGEVLRFGVKKLPSDADYLIMKEMGSAAGSGTDGYSFSLVPDDTIDLDFGTYWYDIGLQSGTDYYNVVPASEFNIVYNVTEVAND